MAIPNQTPSVPTGQTIQLHDIHTPDQISNFPIAPGWWILLALIVISALIIYKKIKQHKQLTAIKKQALATLNNNPAMTAKECISLLKWAAMHYFNRQSLAKLYGDSFQLFLTQQLPEKQQEVFKALTNESFALQYHAEALDLDSSAQASEIKPVSNDINNDCQQAAKLWLSHALPIKKGNAYKLASDKGESQ